MNLTQEHVGKGVACTIRDQFFTEAEARIQRAGDCYYICQSKISGSECEDKLGFSTSWSVETGSEKHQLKHDVSVLSIGGEYARINNNYPIY